MLRFLGLAHTTMYDVNVEDNGWSFPLKLADLANS
jgi:hypothetical protein